MAKIIAVLSIITDLDLKTDRISGQCLREFNACKVSDTLSMLKIFFSIRQIGRMRKENFSWQTFVGI